MKLDEHLKNNRIDCNIYGSNGELLVGVGTPINEAIRKRLSKRTWYFDKTSDYFYDNIALVDDDISDLFDGTTINSKAVINKAKEIVELVLNNPIIFSSLNKIKVYDKYTYDHCNQVSCLTVAMGIRLGFNSRQLINLVVSSLTHDIGKCLIDEKIINKPGKLTKEEYEIVKTHSLLGSKIIANSCDVDKEVAETVLHHHENHDGTGYPCGIDYKDIPLSSAIIHVCDVYDALVSERPYKKRIDEIDSLNILKKDSGKMFDPNIVDTFCSNIQIYRIGSIIELPDGTKVVIKDFVKDEKGNIVEMLFDKLEQEKEKVYTKKYA